MSVTHHPGDELLLGYAAGSLTPAVALIVGTHLHFCEVCRTSVRLGEKIGGVLLETTAPEPLSEDALPKILARLDDRHAVRRGVRSSDDTPSPLRAFLGHDVSQVRWRKMGSNLSYRTLYRRGPLAVRLLRGKPGAGVGHHTHRGTEYTLVLSGGFKDETGAYAPGDFQIASGTTTHNPIADPGEDCINLAVTTGRLRFEDTIRNLVAGLFGF